jgi:hypothetical protein
MSGDATLDLARPYSGGCSTALTGSSFWHILPSIPLPAMVSRCDTASSSARPLALVASDFLRDEDDAADRSVDERVARVGVSSSSSNGIEQWTRREDDPRAPQGLPKLVKATCPSLLHLSPSYVYRQAAVGDSLADQTIPPSVQRFNMNQPPLPPGWEAQWQVPTTSRSAPPLT